MTWVNNENKVSLNSWKWNQICGGLSKMSGILNCQRRTSRLLTTQPSTFLSEQTLRGTDHRMMTSCRSRLLLGAGRVAMKGQSGETGQDFVSLISWGFSLLIYTTKGLSPRRAFLSLLLWDLHGAMGWLNFYSLALTWCCFLAGRGRQHLLDLMKSCHLRPQQSAHWRVP